MTTEHAAGTSPHDTIEHAVERTCPECGAVDAAELWFGGRKRPRIICAACHAEHAINGKLIQAGPGTDGGEPR